MRRSANGRHCGAMLTRSRTRRQPWAGCGRSSSGFVLGLIAKAIIPGKQHMPALADHHLRHPRRRRRQRDRAGLGIDETEGIDWGRHALQLAAAVVIVFLGDMAYIAMRGKRQPGLGPRHMWGGGPTSNEPPPSTCARGDASRLISR